MQRIGRVRRSLGQFGQRVSDGAVRAKPPNRVGRMADGWKPGVSDTTANEEEPTASLGYAMVGSVNDLPRKTVTECLEAGTKAIEGWPPTRRVNHAGNVLERQMARQQSIDQAQILVWKPIAGGVRGGLVAAATEHSKRLARRTPKQQC